MAELWVVKKAVLGLMSVVQRVSSMAAMKADP